MSVKVMGLVLETTVRSFSGRKGQPLGNGHKLLLLALADHAHHDGTSVFPSIATLVDMTEQSERAVQYQLRDLEAAGLLRKVRQASRYRPTEYAILIEALGVHDVHPTDEQPGVQPETPEVHLTVSETPPGVHIEASRGAPDFAPEPLNRHLTAEPSVRTVVHAKNGRRRTPNDDLWDVFVEVLGYVPSNGTEKGKWARGIGHLVESEVSADELRALCSAYVARYKGRVDLNPAALAPHVGELRAQLAGVGVAPGDPAREWSRLAAELREVGA